MTDQVASSEAASAARGPGIPIYERIGDEGLKRAVRAATPLWTRLTGKGAIAEKTLREILSQAYTLRDVDRLYHERHWRRTDFQNRPRRHKVVPVLRKMGVPEK